MSATQVPGVPPNITLITGPLLLGYLFNWGLFGVLCLQVYIYYLSFPRDSRYIKILVYSLFSIDILQTIMTTHNAWHFLSEGWGDVGVLADPGWSWIAVPLFSGMVSCAVQLFFAWRIFKLSHSWLLAGFIACIALAQGIAGMVSGIWFAVLNDITKITSLFPSACVWLGGSALVDVIITFTLVIYLSRSSTGFASTDNIISKLIRMTVETGAVTSTAATVELILFLVYKDNNLHMIPALALAKLYTNTLLATLNARSDTFNASARSRTTTTSTSGGTDWKSTQQRNNSKGVHVTTVHETMQDDVAMVDLQNNAHPGARSDDHIDRASDYDDEKPHSLAHSDLEGGKRKNIDFGTAKGRRI